MTAATVSTISRDDIPCAFNFAAVVTSADAGVVLRSTDRWRSVFGGAMIDRYSSEDEKR